MLKAIADNEGDIRADIKCIDDTIFLKEGTTDGKYFYFKNEKFEVKDQRNAILFNLVRLQKGYISFTDLYMHFINYKPKRTFDYKMIINNFLRAIKDF